MISQRIEQFNSNIGLLTNISLAKAYQKEKEAKEQEFKDTISALQPIFEQLYPKLEQAGASISNPLKVHAENFELDFYIDDRKNIH